jgi:hypothetical protein
VVVGAAVVVGATVEVVAGTVVVVVVAGGLVVGGAVVGGTVVGATVVGGTVVEVVVVGRFFASTRTDCPSSRKIVCSAGTCARVVVPTPQRKATAATAIVRWSFMPASIPGQG